MLHERNYMKNSWNAPSELNFENSAVLKLLLINVAFFVIQALSNTLFPGVSFIENIFAFSRTSVLEGKFWTFLTYSFLHAHLLHIAGNMLGLYFIGKEIEPSLGKKRFITLYLGSALLGSVFFICSNYGLIGASPTVIGASASISGILCFYCLLKPEERITILLFFLIPITIQPKWLLRIYLGITLLMVLNSELLNNSDVAHSAHLGGIIAGYVYFYLFYSDSKYIFKNNKEPKIELPKWLKQKQKQKQMSFSINFSDPESELKEEVNLILDKINLKGFESLTNKEKDTLEKAKDIF